MLQLRQSLFSFKMDLLKGSGLKALELMHGRGGGTRTLNSPVKSRILYQLSYTPRRFRTFCFRAKARFRLCIIEASPCCWLAGQVGFEPTVDFRRQSQNLVS
jgi:hypothetical protein